VYARIYAEEESVDIQHMIAQFYNKFDELHEKSLMAALAAQPDRKVIKNEVKYRIPDRWTKKFNKHDIVSLDLFKGTGIENEQGKVNKRALLDKKRQVESNREKSIQLQMAGEAPMSNPILQHTLSSRNSLVQQKQNNN